MKIALFGKQFGEKFLSKFQYIINFLEKKGIAISLDERLVDYVDKEFGVSLNDYPTYKEFSEDLDMILSIGGDGTFLEAALWVKDKNIPILGINSGRLGFLAVVAPHEVERALDLVINEKYDLEERSLVKIVSPENLMKETPFALNEVGIFKTDTSSMITVKAYLGEKFITSYWSDGLLMATPTGSTAYSLSVGGAIIAPDCENFIISPVAPHNLTVRPIIIPDNRKVRFKVDCRSSHFLVSLDSRFERVSSGTEIVVEKADFTIKIVRFSEMSFFKTLRNKLMWGVDKRN